MKTTTMSGPCPHCGNQVTLTSGGVAPVVELDALPPLDPAAAQMLGVPAGGPAAPPLVVCDPGREPPADDYTDLDAWAASEFPAVPSPDDVPPPRPLWNGNVYRVERLGLVEVLDARHMYGIHYGLAAIAALPHLLSSEDGRGVLVYVHGDEVRHDVAEHERVVTVAAASLLLSELVETRCAPPIGRRDWPRVGDIRTFVPNPQPHDLQFVWWRARSSWTSCLQSRLRLHGFCYSVRDLDSYLHTDADAGIDAAEHALTIAEAAAGVRQAGYLRAVGRGYQRTSGTAGHDTATLLFQSVLVDRVTDDMQHPSRIPNDVLKPTFTTVDAALKRLAAVEGWDWNETGHQRRFCEVVDLMARCRDRKYDAKLAAQGLRAAWDCVPWGEHFEHVAFTTSAINVDAMLRAGAGGDIPGLWTAVRELAGEAAAAVPQSATPAAVPADAASYAAGWLSSLLRCLDKHFSGGSSAEQAAAAIVNEIGAIVALQARVAITPETFVETMANSGVTEAETRLVTSEGMRYVGAVWAEIDKLCSQLPLPRNDEARPRL